MKKSAFSLFFIFVALFCYSQTDWKNIPKNAKQIFIETGKSEIENIKYIQPFLLDEGFEIEKTDTTLFTVKTGLKKTNKRGGTYYLNFRAKGNKIIVSGKFKSGISIEIYGVRAEDDWEDIEKIGSKGSIYEIVFTEMCNLAQNLGKTEFL